MDAVLQSFFAGFPTLISHFAITTAMLAVGVVIYVWITPHREFRLIREGNVAAAVSLSSAIMGIGLPLAVCMANSVRAEEILIWGALTLVIQLVAFKAADLILRDLPKRIEAGEIGPALVLVAVKLAVAAINAAAVSG